MSTPNKPSGLAPLDRQQLSAPLRRLIDFFEHITEQTVADMPSFYAADAYFKDPFNEVRGLTGVQGIFSHMFVALDKPHFVVTKQLVDGAQCFLTWNFVFRFKRFSPDVWQTVRGGSHLELSPEGLIAFHRDYWDTAEELYEKLPAVGSLMRWLKRRANT